MMAGYIAMRCVKYLEKNGLGSAQDYYKKILTLYPQFKDDVDAILMSDGYDEIIVELA